MRMLIGPAAEFNRHALRDTPLHAIVSFGASAYGLLDTELDVRHRFVAEAGRRSMPVGIEEAAMSMSHQRLSSQRRGHPPLPARVRRPAPVARCALTMLLAWFAWQSPRSQAAGHDAGAPWVRELQAGGYVLVMRHAEAPAGTPGASEAEPDNPRHERQLDARGKRQAAALGSALRRLRIPIGPIYSSPTYRALETVRLA